MIDHGKHNVLGAMIDAVDYDVAVERIMAAAIARQPLAVSALAVHGVMTGVLDREHRQRLNSFHMLLPDGQPVRWALRWLYGLALRDRVYGPELMLRVCSEAGSRKLPVFLFGGTERLLTALSERLRGRFPGLQVAGVEPSRFRNITADEHAEVLNRINGSGAAITFVGLGCPRQEVWTYESVHRLSMPVLAVGAAFSIHAGLVSQAPPRLQAMGFEWLYRLVQDPARLWKRYLLLNPMYLTLLALQLTGVRRIEASRSEDRPVKELRYG